MLTVSVQSNVAAQLNRVSGEVEAAQEKALDRVAQVVLNAKAREVQKTYARPIPKRKNGRPAWVRTGQWQKGQGIKRGRLLREIGPLNDSAKYEPRLANLRTERRNEAAQEAFTKTEPQIQKVFEQELRNALNL